MYTGWKKSTGEPLRLRGWGVAREQRQTLLLAVNLSVRTTSDITRVREVNGFVSGYATAVDAHHDGKVDEAPLRVRLLEVNNTGNPPKTYQINNTKIRLYLSGAMSSPEFVETLMSSERIQTEQERTWARNLDKTATNQTVWPNGTVTAPDAQ